MQSGELIVTGKDKATIPLHKFPAEVKVRFKDHEVVVPCNPHHRDELEWEVHSSNHHQGGFVLVISWSVTNVREIVWHASY
jgi:hypothetical protein